MHLCYSTPELNICISKEKAASQVEMAVAAFEKANARLPVGAFSQNFTPVLRKALEYHVGEALRMSPGVMLVAGVPGSNYYFKTKLSIAEVVNIETSFFELTEMHGFTVKTGVTTISTQIEKKQ